MKIVQAIIRKEKLNDVLTALFEIEVHGFTVTEVTGHGGETEKVETYRGTTVKVSLSEKIKLEIGISDHFLEPTIQAILKSASTGEVGDGKIFIIPVEKVYRIRTGDVDEGAVTPRVVPQNSSQ